jgi:hypothetical protein
MRGVFAIGKPKKGRVTWAAWWTVRPTRARFTGPDAHGTAVDEHAARGAAFAAFAQVRGCRQWSEIDAEFALAAERWLAGKPLPWEKGKPRRAPDDTRSIGAIADIDVSVLGLQWPVSFTEARDAYRQRALASHPDRGGTHEEMLALNRTWAALKKAFGED